MAITLKQAAVVGVTASGSTVAATFGSNTTTGNTIVAIVYGFNGSGSITVSGVATNAGAATFTKKIAQISTNLVPSCEAWIAPNITGGTTPKITATFSGAPAAQEIVIFELAGMPTATTDDGTAAAKQGTSATACTAPTITTLGSNTVVFSAFAPSGSMTAGESGWQVSGVGAGGVDAIAQYIIETAPQTSLIPTSTQSPAGVYTAITFALAGASTNKPLAGTITAAAAHTGAPRATKPLASTVTASAANTGLARAKKSLFVTCSPAGSLTAVLKEIDVFLSSCSIKAAHTAALHETNPLAATCQIKGSLTGIARATKRLASTCQSVTTVTGAVVTIKLLYSSDQITGSLTGLLRATKLLFAVCHPSANHSAPLIQTNHLVSTATVSGKHIETLGVRKPLSGTVTATAAHIANVSPIKPLIAAVTISASDTGAFRSTKPLASSVTARGPPTALLSQTYALRGPVTLTGSATAAFKATKPLAASAPSHGSLTGAVIQGNNVSAFCLPRGHHTVALLLARAYGGTLTVTGSLSGFLRIPQPLAAVGTAQGNSSANVRVMHVLAGSCSIKAAHQGAPISYRPLAGTVSAKAALTGVPRATKSLFVTALSAAQITGNLLCTVRLTASASAKSGSTAHVSTASPLAGSVSIKANHRGGIALLLRGSCTITAQAAGSFTATQALIGSILVQWDIDPPLSNGPAAASALFISANHHARLRSAQKLSGVCQIQAGQQFFVQGSFNNISGSGTTNAVTLLGQAVGNTNVVAIGCANPASAVTVTDSNGNLYYQIVGPRTNSNIPKTMFIFVSRQISPANPNPPSSIAPWDNTITVTFNPASTVTEVIVAEYDNLLAMVSA